MRSEFLLSVKTEVRLQFYKFPTALFGVRKRDIFIFAGAEEVVARKPHCPLQYKESTGVERERELVKELKSPLFCAKNYSAL